MRLLLSVGSAFWLGACLSAPASFEGFPCDAGVCIDGYECHPLSNTCVPVLQRDCSGGGVCWSSVSTGDACDVSGAFLPCGSSSACDSGCRTCVDGQWSACSGTGGGGSAGAGAGASSGGGSGGAGAIAGTGGTGAVVGSGGSGGTGAIGGTGGFGGTGAIGGTGGFGGTGAIGGTGGTGGTGGSTCIPTTEGPAVDATCYDGIDNDCDGDHDALDADCWWNADFNRRVRLDFNNLDRGAITELPVLVVLEHDAADADSTGPAGEALRFIDDDGLTVLPHEIDTWNANGRSYIWVLVPTIDAHSDTDHIWMYYDNPAASDEQPPATVWKNYVAVWHMGEDPTGTAPQFRDASGHDHHASVDGGSSFNASRSTGGIVGNSLSFDGRDDRISAASSDLLNMQGDQPFTVSAWVHREWSFGNPGDSWQGIVSKGNSQQYALSVNRPDRYLHFETNQGGPGPLDSPNGTAPAHEWLHVAGVYDGTHKIVYVNGESRGSVAASYSAVSNTEELRIGEGNNGEDFLGRIDEVRISRMAFSPDYLHAEHSAGNNTLLIYNPEEIRVP